MLTWQSFKLIQGATPSACNRQLLPEPSPGRCREKHLVLFLCSSSNHQTLWSWDESGATAASSLQLLMLTSLRRLPVSVRLKWLRWGVQKRMKRSKKMSRFLQFSTVVFLVKTFKTFESSFFDCLQKCEMIKGQDSLHKSSQTLAWLCCCGLSCNIGPDYERCEQQTLW